MLGVVQHLENAMGSAFSLGPEHENLKRIGVLKSGKPLLLVLRICHLFPPKI